LDRDTYSKYGNGIFQGHFFFGIYAFWYLQGFPLGLNSLHFLRWNTYFVLRSLLASKYGMAVVELTVKNIILRELG